MCRRLHIALYLLLGVLGACGSEAPVLPPAADSEAPLAADAEPLPSTDAETGAISDSAAPPDNPGPVFGTEDTTQSPEEVESATDATPEGVSDADAALVDTPDVSTPEEDVAPEAEDVMTNAEVADEDTTPEGPDTPEPLQDTSGADSVEGDAAEDAGPSEDVDSVQAEVEDTAVEDVLWGIEPVGCEGKDNGTPCEDGSLCTQGDSCLIGQCVPGEATQCNGQGPCRLGSCDPLDGTCSYTDAPEDAPCDDQDACTSVSLCQAGLCVATESLACPDQGPCQVVSCDPSEGCVAEFLSDGLPCDAPCHDIASCVEGICVGDPNAIPPCPPSETPCVESWICDTNTGDCTIPIPVDAGSTCDSDGSKCTLESCDGLGGCQLYGEDDCGFEASFDPCWDYACDPDMGCYKSVWAPTDACPGPVCGDSYCMEDEDCFNCPGDCGQCCGNGTCTPSHEENCDQCPEDCGQCCGNGQCDFGEDCFSCSEDCGSCCGDGACVEAHLETCLGCPDDCGECCGNGQCDGPELGENCFSCPEECGSCCGNGQCDYGETCLTCENDCGACCTSGVCALEGEQGDTCQTCPELCGECCGNGTCDPQYGESCAVCEADCGACCGDGTCDATVGETCGYCPEDCGSCCGNGVCDPGEDCTACPGDCGLCACGNGLCCGGETCESCQADCGACPAPGSVLAACPAGADAGIQRDCGWTMAGKEPCTPDETITIACHGEAPCNLGSCQGDAMLRICDGEAESCTAAQALAQNDNACGTSCPYLTFICPPSGGLTILTGAHIPGDSYQCIWSSYPETQDPTLPCSETSCDLERECGWVRSEVMPCSAGIPIEIGCGGGEGCGIGSSTGDPMIRVCAGDHVHCDAGTALGSSDDAPSCGQAPSTQFTCPPEGVVTILTAPKCTNAPHYSCELCAACPSCTPSW